MSTAADRIASIAGITIDQVDGTLLAALGTRSADITGEILAMSGVSVADLPPAIEAARRCMDAAGWTPENAAEFVATAAAIGGLDGPRLLLVPNLAKIAARG